MVIYLVTVVITDGNGPGALQTEHLHALMDVYMAPKPGVSGPSFYVKTVVAVKELADNFSPLKGESNKFFFFVLMFMYIWQHTGAISSEMMTTTSSGMAVDPRSWHLTQIIYLITCAPCQPHAFQCRCYLRVDSEQRSHGNHRDPRIPWTRCM